MKVLLYLVISLGIYCIITIPHIIYAFDHSNGIKYSLPFILLCALGSHVITIGVFKKYLK